MQRLTDFWNKNKVAVLVTVGTLLLGAASYGVHSAYKNLKASFCEPEQKQEEARPATRSTVNQYWKRKDQK